MNRVVPMFPHRSQIKKKTHTETSITHINVNHTGSRKDRSLLIHAIGHEFFIRDSVYTSYIKQQHNFSLSPSHHHPIRNKHFFNVNQLGLVV